MLLLKFYFQILKHYSFWLIVRVHFCFTESGSWVSSVLKDFAYSSYPSFVQYKTSKFLLSDGLLVYSLKVVNFLQVHWLVKEILSCETVALLVVLFYGHCKFMFCHMTILSHKHTIVTCPYLCHVTIVTNLIISIIHFVTYTVM